MKMKSSLLLAIVFVMLAIFVRMAFAWGGGDGGSGVSGGSSGGSCCGPAQIATLFLSSEDAETVMEYFSDIADAELLVLQAAHLRGDLCLVTENCLGVDPVVFEMSLNAEIESRRNMNWTQKWMVYIAALSLPLSALSLIFAIVFGRRNAARVD